MNIYINLIIILIFAVSTCSCQISLSNNKTQVITNLDNLENIFNESARLPVNCKSISEKAENLYFRISIDSLDSGHLASLNRIKNILDSINEKSLKMDEFNNSYYCQQASLNLNALIESIKYINYNDSFIICSLLSEIDNKMYQKIPFGPQSKLLRCKLNTISVDTLIKLFHANLNNSNISEILAKNFIKSRNSLEDVNNFIIKTIQSSRKITTLYPFLIFTFVTQPGNYDHYAEIINLELIHIKSNEMSYPSLLDSIENFRNKKIK